jgi:hypothetical protein
MRVGCDGGEEFEFGLLVEERWGGQSPYMGDGERSLLRGQNWAGAEGKVALADPCLVLGLNNRRHPNRECAVSQIPPRSQLLALDPW